MYLIIDSNIAIRERIGPKHTRLHISIFWHTHIFLEGHPLRVALAHLHKFGPDMEGVVVRVMSRVKPSRNQSIRGSPFLFYIQS